MFLGCALTTSRSALCIRVDSQQPEYPSAQADPDSALQHTRLAFPEAAISRAPVMSAPVCCTYLISGDTFLAQPVWECVTPACGFQEGEVVCEACRASCHATCDTRQMGEAVRAYCDCGHRSVAGGPHRCRSLVAANAAGSASSASVAALQTPSPPPAIPAPSTAPAASSSSQPVSPRAPSLERPRSAQSSLKDTTHQRTGSAAASSSGAGKNTSVAAKALAKAAAFSIGSTLSPPPFTTNAVIPSECTFNSTGATFTAQPIYACYTCGLTGDYAVCYYCILRCHAHHKIAFVSDSQRSYCDCPRSCPPAAKGGSRGNLGQRANANAAVGGASSLSRGSSGGAPVPVPCQALTPLPHREARALAFLCTLTQTGTNFHLQMVYHCQDCGIRDDEICCQSCALVCHKGHKVEARGEMRAYCDCSSNGLCQCLDLASVVHAQSASSSHAGTPGLFSTSRRHSLTAVPHVELTDMSQSSSAASSRKTSRRPSLIQKVVKKPTTAATTASVPTGLHASEHTSNGVSAGAQGWQPGEEEMDMRWLGSSSSSSSSSSLPTTPAASSSSALDQLPSSSPSPEPLDPAVLSAAAAASSSFTSSSDALPSPPVPVAVPSSPRSIRSIIRSLPSRPSLEEFLDRLKLREYREVFEKEGLDDVAIMRDAMSERQLEALVPQLGHRLKLKSALLALRQRDKQESADAAAEASASSSSLSIAPALPVFVDASVGTSPLTPAPASPPLLSTPAHRGSLTHAAQAADARANLIYRSVLHSFISSGVLRSTDEQVLASLRHQNHITFAQHQSTLRELGISEEELETLKRNGQAEQGQAEQQVQQQQHPSAPNHVEGEKKDAHADAAGATCAVCLSAPATRICIPCGHLCLCGECALRFINGVEPSAGAATSLANGAPVDSPRLQELECIKCRAPVEHVYRAFF